MTPCVIGHKERQLRAMIHGDDFTLLGNEVGLGWFRDNIQRQLEVKTRGRLGPGVNDQKFVRIPNRIITWNKDKIQFEADQRHAEIIVKQLVFKGSSNAVCTPRMKSAMTIRRDLVIRM